jgi:DNA polymerase-3 subunit epsilon
VLEGEFARYPDLPTDPDAFDREINPRDPFNVDREGRFRWVNREATVNFGKKKGQTLRALAAEDPSFLRWISRNDFPLDTRRIASDALAGRFPECPFPAPGGA